MKGSRRIRMQAEDSYQSVNMTIIKGRAMMINCTQSHLITTHPIPSHHITLIPSHPIPLITTHPITAHHIDPIPSHPLQSHPSNPILYNPPKPIATL